MTSGNYMYTTAWLSGVPLCGHIRLRECADSLCTPLTDLFNKSMNDSIFPSLWKLSNISPVYKKALRHLKENYRPVSLLSCMSKIMERIVYNALYNFFKLHGLLSERNSGFKEKDSTINQLVHLCHNILASCPWGPATDHGVGLLTEMHAIYMERYASHRTIVRCIGSGLFPLLALCQPHWHPANTPESF